MTPSQVKFSTDLTGYAPAGVFVPQDSSHLFLTRELAQVTLPTRPKRLEGSVLCMTAEQDRLLVSLWWIEFGWYELMWRTAFRNLRQLRNHAASLSWRI